MANLVNGLGLQTCWKILRTKRKGTVIKGIEPPHGHEFCFKNVQVYLNMYILHLDPAHAKLAK